MSEGPRVIFNDFDPVKAMVDQWKGWVVTIKIHQGDEHVIKVWRAESDDDGDAVILGLDWNDCATCGHELPPGPSRSIKWDDIESIEVH